MRRRRGPKDGSFVRIKYLDSDEWHDGQVDGTYASQFAVVLENGTREMVMVNGSIEWQEVT